MNAEISYSGAVPREPSKAIYFPLPPPRPLSPFWRQTCQLLLVAALTVASYFLISHYVVQAVQVVGSSMQPTLMNSDRLLLNRLIYHIRDPERFDVVVLKDPAGGYAVKRVIAMAGDSVLLKAGRVYVNGQKLSEPYLPPKTPTYPIGTGPSSFTLGPGKYFVMGDNRLNSADSREYGPIPKDSILGAVILR
jgi:signal peptidase I